jgi:hypothetical protein
MFHFFGFGMLMIGFFGSRHLKYAILLYNHLNKDIGEEPIFFLSFTLKIYRLKALYIE